MAMFDQPTDGNIVKILMAWRNAVDMGADGWTPLPTAGLAIGDSVYGHIEEDAKYRVSRVVMYAEPFTITAIDDTYWRDKYPRRRVLKHDRGIGETHLNSETRVIVVKGYSQDLYKTRPTVIANALPVPAPLPTSTTDHTGGSITDV